MLRSSARLALVFALWSCVQLHAAGPAAASDVHGAQRAVEDFYRALTTKDAPLLRSLYADPRRWSDARLAQRFGGVESAEVVRFLGVQHEDDLAHVSATVRIVSSEGGHVEHAVSHHDFCRIADAWRFCAADALGDADRARLRALWTRQAQQQQGDPAARGHLQWLRAEQREAADRRGKLPVRVAQ